MPRGDGTGPRGQGPGTGSGRGQDRGQSGGGRFGAGPAGFCKCVACGEKIAHQAGTPCYGVKCPKCGATMTRDLE